MPCSSATRAGRLIVAGIGVLTGAVLLAVTLAVPVTGPGLILLMLALTALFIPFAAPNVIATVYDVTLPEVRSTALSIQYFIESAARRSRRSSPGSSPTARRCRMRSY